ncbi:hypothetical protein GPECTOR_58g541 [Gonium pectorale]|uniref:EF-hand domain-containing protein n=1 Tax=Gonium pectorale TaxID=33097 RepID=A0A150G5G1_GONPE|nr:hypothetical protein GPECTOR_58g541 [Gonium pectorale]|eukprot:KXZ45092.1 hypothetical protein GPECTOR_58g541 [Gonium pectorale]
MYRVRDYMEQLLGSGMTAERAQQVIAQWSGGGGIEMVDLVKLRRHFLMSTLLPVLQQRLPHALIDVALTSLSFWSLGLLPAADEQLLHPALRGALVAVNLLLLALADGHGNLMRAAQGSPVAAALAEVDVERVMAAAAAAIRHAKRTAAAATAAAATPAAAESAARASGGGSLASALSSLDSFLVLQQAASGATSGGAGSGYGKYSTSGGATAAFDAVAELGMTPDEAAAVAAMYARFGDSSRGGRIGDYEFRRLLQEAGFPPLTESERALALLLADPDKKGWLSFRDWATWWANSPPAQDE